MGREEEIKIIAHRIWEEEGYCDGHEMEHWLSAEVIWEEKQKNKAAPKNAKAESKQIKKRSKTDRKASKKH
jgi:hypothetical protein